LRRHFWAGGARADEPASLDPQGIHWLRGFLRGLAGEGADPHLEPRAARSANRRQVVIIHRGRLVRQAAMADVEAMAAVRRRSLSEAARRSLAGRGS
jgi:ABC-2 type transport system ATP-binding protein